jgi:hypothetical protein
MVGMDTQYSPAQGGHQLRIPNRSEPVIHASEQEQNVPKSFGTDSGIVPNVSGTVPNQEEHRSERTETASELQHGEEPEPQRTAPICSPEHAEHTITVREAARIFEDNDVPRTERAITNWCNENARGVTRLDACYDEEQRKYYITEASIARAIQEERDKSRHRGQQGVFSAAAGDLSERIQNEVDNRSEQTQNGSERDAKSSERVQNGSERVPNRSEEIGAHVRNERNDSEADETQEPSEKERLRSLQVENFNLKVQVAAHEKVMAEYEKLARREQEVHQEQLRTLVDKLTSQGQRIGSLEQQLLQLDAGKSVVRDAELTGAREEQPQDARAWQGVQQ